MPVRERSIIAARISVWSPRSMVSRNAVRRGVFRGWAARLRVEDYAAADGGDGRKLANDESVAGEEQDFFAEAEVRERGFSGPSSRVL